jgi:hypothetical protein
MQWGTYLSCDVSIISMPNCYFVAGSLGAVSGTIHSGLAPKTAPKVLGSPYIFSDRSANLLVAGTMRGPATFAGSHLDTQVSLSIFYLTLHIEEYSLQGTCNSRSTLSCFGHLMSLLFRPILRVYHS